MTFDRFDPIDPDETDVFTWDFSAQIAEVPGDALAAILGVVADAGDGLLTIGTPSATGATVSVKISTATLGQNYAVRARIATTAGRVLDLTGTIYCEEK